MKHVSNLLSRVKHALVPRRGKKGSSLALVMAIGSVLVIWVMCIMPLMSTTGNVAYKTIGSQVDYLASRSAIEFCKSELRHIVETEMPYTFAVTGDAESGYTPVRKYASATSTTPTTAYIGLADANTDVPKSGSVAAVCVVTPTGSLYEITITTYNNGNKGMVYKATFKPNGSLLIFPESYNHNQALPLSDFVLVDGWLGDNEVWTSTIKATIKSSGTVINNYSEYLKPWKQPSELDEKYANSGEYPAVFKMTANTAASSSDIDFGTPVPDERTDQIWIQPTAVQTNSTTPGSIWYTTDHENKIHIWMYTSKPDSTGNYSTKAYDITGDCVIYLNGNIATTVPEKAGTYQVSIDYKGVEYDSNANAINVLPVMGLQMINPIRGSAAPKQHSLSEDDKKAGFSVEKIPVKENNEIVGYTYTIRISSSATDLMFCCVEQGSSEYAWTYSKEFSNLEAGKNYFFYVCRPASMVADEFHLASAVEKLGMVITPSYTSGSLTNGNYIILTEDGANMLTKQPGLTPFSLNSDFLVVNSDYISNYGFTATNNTFTFSNLGISGEATGTPNAIRSFSHGFLFWAHKCEEYENDNCDLKEWKLSLTSDATTFNVAYSDGAYNLFKDISYKFEYNQYKCGDGGTRSKTFTTTAYLNLNDGISPSDVACGVRLISLPSQPDTIPAPSIPYSLKDNWMWAKSSAYKFVQNNLLVGGSADHSHKVSRIYSNSQELSTDSGYDLLNAGIYDLIIKTYVDEKMQDVQYTALNQQLYVQKNKPNAENLSKWMTVAANANDDMTIVVSVDGYEKNGVLYFGYKPAGADESTPYNWFPANGDSTTFKFRLDYGSYTFAVMDTGNINVDSIVSAGISFDTKPKTLTSEDLSQINGADFLYSYTRGDSPDTVVWVKMPTDLNVHPGRVDLVFGVPAENGNIVWQREWSKEVRYFGVIIHASPYEKLENALQIPAPVAVTNNEGHTTSMMRGSSLYFMSDTTSIATYNNSVYLTTDLLVLNGNISGGGAVYVEPYSTGAKNTLLYIANKNGITGRNGTVYEGRTYYLVPAYTDISNLNANTIQAMKEDVEDVKQGTIDDIYPEINLDIAYADKTQLAHIISGKTAGWVNESGIISGSDSSTKSFRQYAVCAYISGMNGATSRSANRVLLASRGAIDVKSTLTITTRYLSVDAPAVNQQNGSPFYLKNLAQDSGIISTIAKALGVSKYSSKSLQMDYERVMNFGGETRGKEIVRYDHDVNLFNSPEKLPLMASYTTTEIKGKFNAVSSTFASVDRYTAIIGEGELDLKAYFSCEYRIFTNYLYIDPRITSINTTTSAIWLDFGSDIKINSQERGYKDDYLSFYGNYSTESYAGTLICIGDPTKPSGTITLTYDEDEEPVVLNYGFYYMPASGSGTGTSVSALKDLWVYSEEDPKNKNNKPWSVPLTDLQLYSVYIKPDGTLSDAYVDTGLAGGNIVGLGGFLGGKVE